VRRVRWPEEIELGCVTLDARAVANPGGGGELAGQRIRQPLVVPHGSGSGAEFAGQQHRLQGCSASDGGAGRGRDRMCLLVTGLFSGAVVRLVTSEALVRRCLVFATGLALRGGRFPGGFSGWERLGDGVRGLVGGFVELFGPVCDGFPGGVANCWYLVNGVRDLDGHFAQQIRGQTEYAAEKVSSGADETGRGLVYRAEVERQELTGSLVQVRHDPVSRFRRHLGAARD